MSKPHEFQMNNLLKNLHDYFTIYESIKISLTEIEDPCYSVINVTSYLDDIHVNIEIYVDEFMTMYDSTRKVITLGDIWRLLHLESMKNFQLARERLLKELDKQGG